MPKTSITGSLISIAIDKTSDAPIYRQVTDRLRDAILAGQIGVGVKLPSTRIFADELGVSRNTIVQVFDTLIGEGYLSSRIGDGTYVADVKHVISEAAAGEIAQNSQYPFRSLSRRGKAVVASASGAFVERPTPFMPDLPDLREFPIRTWLRLLNETSGRLRGELLADTTNAGYEPLRRAIAQYLNSSRGMTCDYSQVIVTTGSQQSLDLVSRMLLDPGDPIWLEEPGYVGARSVFAANGASIYPIPVDEDGMCVEDAIRAQPSPVAIFTSSSRHYPLGATLSLDRRLQMVDLAGRTGAWIVEDNYDHEFRYEGASPASIHGLDVNKRTIHLGTFSKILLPSFRLGYVVVPPDLAVPFARARTVIDRHASLIEQMVLSEFMHRGLLSAHVRRMRGLYRARQRHLTGGLRSVLNAQIDFAASETGMHIVLPLRDNVNDVALAQTAIHKGIVLRPLSPYYAGRRRRQGLLFGFSAFNQAEADEGLSRLSSISGELATSIAYSSKDSK